MTAAHDPSALDLSHLRRDTRTALELAIAALAPESLIHRLAAAAGLFEALIEFPRESPPVIALTPRLAANSRSALDEWERWRKDHLGHVKA